ncbi:DUF4747 family protein [Pectobacterium brasiliense]|uniref:DUF4747 family protein n=1 Tax=Pectobacterium brasiliense TaxID=180957 RepID=UPI00196A13CB|nr:DUF4747 family protein [Pectobacterium brasiliense]MBN3342623.1 DUF4747 family protein [Pectobacterium brasiliense]
MAIYKFYNVQMLPISTDVDNIGAEGYFSLFKSLSDLIDEIKRERYKLSSIAVSMRGDMFFAPFHIDFYEYPGIDKSKKIIYGSFLKFDDVNELVDTNSGETEYRSKGNTSSKRYSLEFVFDPYTHMLAIHDTKGLPTRTPLIKALKEILEYHAMSLFKNHNLEIEELTSADSISEFLSSPKKGYKNYNGFITFSNSDEFDEAIEKDMLLTEQELKEKRVGKWEVNYKSFSKSVMNDLPRQAIIQMLLATRYGNAEVSYLDENGDRQKYQMDNYPLRESFKDEQVKGNRDRALEILGLINKALNKTKNKIKTVISNKNFLDRKD